MAMGSRGFSLDGRVVKNYKNNIKMLHPSQANIDQRLNFELVTSNVGTSNCSFSSYYLPTSILCFQTASAYIRDSFCQSVGVK